MSAYAEVIRKKKQPIIEAQAEREAAEKAAELRKEAIKERRSGSKKIAEKAQKALAERLEEIGIVRLIDSAVNEFGGLADDERGANHGVKGGPKKVGAWTTILDHWTYEQNFDPDDPDVFSLTYALAGKSFNYLTRQGSKYQLSRYAIVLAQGRETDDDLAACHEELPSLRFTSLGIGDKKDSFDKRLSAAINAQDNELIYQRDRTHLRLYPPNLVAARAEPVKIGEDGIAHELLEGISVGLGEFAEAHYIPLEKQYSS